MAGEFTEDEFREKLRAIADGDRDMGEGAIVEALHRLGLITGEARDSEGWVSDRTDLTLLTDAGRRLLGDELDRCTHSRANDVVADDGGRHRICR
jgi:hypothetical protein